MFASDRIVDLVLALTFVEAIGLVAIRRMDLLITVAAGVALLLALRCALAGSPWPWIAVCLLAALAAHMADVWLRRTKS